MFFRKFKCGNAFKEFYTRDTVAVARDLLGCLLVREVDGTVLVGRITETEAYGGSNDPASHAYRGKTVRNAPMFGAVGCWYVYFVYGNHFCCNLVAKDETAEAGAVLLRAVEPLEGLERMRIVRQLKSSVSDKQLSNGPGKLCLAFQINKTFNSVSACDGLLTVTQGQLNADEKIIALPRIGIQRGKDLLWRFSLVKGLPN